MKTRFRGASRRPRQRGFTLLELLVVMVVIAILAALTLGAFRYAQESAARNRTVGAHATITAALEQYKEKFGEYPEPANPQEKDEFGGNTMTTGGAHMLYQAITADGNSAIALKTPPAGGTSESDGNISENELDSVITSSPLPKSVIFPTNATAGQTRPRLIVDGWNRPFQYTKAAVVETPTTPGGTPPEPVTVNPTYDLWSFGPMTEGSTVGESLDLKQNPDVTAKWIKNW